jgi:uncharacterized lipoprotein YddW (UPF0748 family)
VIPAGFAIALAVASGCGDSHPPASAPEPAREAASRAPPVASAPRPAEPEPASRARRRALWVLCEGSQRVLERPERIDALLADAERLGATDLFVQVYRAGRAWFDSSHADAAPHRAILAAHGTDTLAALVERAHARGLRVHAWVNVLSLAANRDAPVVQALGPAAVQVDRSGRSLLDYPDFEVPEPERRYYRMGTPALWLDPAAPGVAASLAATFAELVERYPTLDGLHLDYIRYPDVLPFIPGSRFGVGLEFGFGEASRRRFREETGLEAPFRAAAANANRFDDWRRERVTGVVREIRAAALAKRPALELSAAVWAYPDRAYLSLFQDWRGWLEEDLLSFAVPMLYTLDDRLVRYNAQAFVGGVGGSRVWIGLGAWLFAARPERAAQQLREAEAAGPAGIAFFSWDALADAPALFAALAAEVGRGG